MGILLFAASKMIVSALGGDEMLVAGVTISAGLIGVVFAISFLTGFNIGMPASIRGSSVRPGSLVDGETGLCLLVTSVTVFFSGMVFMASG